MAAAYREHGLRRVSAGVYETRDGLWRIIKTEHDCGPRGGTLRLWEIAEPDRWAGWVISGHLPSSTLREARVNLAAAVAQEAAS